MQILIPLIWSDRAATKEAGFEQNRKQRDMTRASVLAALKIPDDSVTKPSVAGEPVSHGTPGTHRE